MIVKYENRDLEYLALMKSPFLDLKPHLCTVEVNVCLDLFPTALHGSKMKFEAGGIG